jgi:hypothetical protein
MAITPTLISQWFDGKRLWVHLTLTFSGSYVSGGDTLDVSKIGIKSSGPLAGLGDINGQSATAYTFVVGTTLANNLVKCFQGALAEVAAGAYPGSITGDTVNALFYCRFNR